MIGTINQGMGKSCYLCKLPESLCKCTAIYKTNTYEIISEQFINIIYTMDENGLHYL